jgi:hypothetical protein
MTPHFLKRYSPYQIAVMLSSLSLVFGGLRELMIAGLLGFTEKNDMLQVYLSVFYISSLNIDAMRLSCLNLYQSLSLFRMALLAFMVGTACALVTCLLMTDLSDKTSLLIMSVTILGSGLHLLSALLITYRQKQDLFLPAQIINVLPNVFLIPGILLCYLFSFGNPVHAIVILTSLVPAIQCILLFMLKGGTPAPVIPKQTGLLPALVVFARHSSSMAGEQLFQVIARTAFLRYGHGYLSMYALTVRLYSAFRFVMVDSWIGSRLNEWKTRPGSLPPARNSILAGSVIALATLCVSLLAQHNLIQTAIQALVLLLSGFYFTAALRILYFRINQQEGGNPPVIRFAVYEMAFAFLAFLLTRQASYPVIALLWLGYIAKPFTQLLMLQKHSGSLSHAG